MSKLSAHPTEMSKLILKKESTLRRTIRYKGEELQSVSSLFTAVKEGNHVGPSCGPEVIKQIDMGTLAIRLYLMSSFVVLIGFKACSTIL